MGRSLKEIQIAWNMAAIIKGRNKEKFREDVLGNVLHRDSHGSQTKEGFEIDHIKPVAKSGTDHPDNLQILSTKANREKSDKY